MNKKRMRRGFARGVQRKLNFFQINEIGEISYVRKFQQTAIDLYRN